MTKLEHVDVAGVIPQLALGADSAAQKLWPGKAAGTLHEVCADKYVPTLLLSQIRRVRDVHEIAALLRLSPHIWWSP